MTDINGRPAAASDHPSPEARPGGALTAIPADELRELEARLASSAEGMTIEHMSPSRLAWRRFRARKTAIVSVFVLAILAIIVFFPNLVTSADPDERLGFEHRLEEPTLGIVPPSWGEFPLGTDRNQRDMLSRVLHGGQISMTVGVTVALAAGAIGVTVGALSGYFGRTTDLVLMRLTDLVLAVPFLVGAIILFVATTEVNINWLPGSLGRGTFWLGESRTPRLVASVLALLIWPGIARLVRAEILSLRERDFIEAARALGASGRRVILRHLIPNAVSTIVVALTLAVATAILAEAVLSFLGFGVEAFTPTWGGLMSDGRDQILTGNAHLVWFPGIMVVITVLCINFIGDGLRDALDPKQRLGVK